MPEFAAMPDDHGGARLRVEPVARAAGRRPAGPGRTAVPTLGDLATGGTA
jgi:hypothetical protein